MQVSRAHVASQSPLKAQVASADPRHAGVEAGLAGVSPVLWALELASVLMDQFLLEE